MIFSKFFDSEEDKIFLKLIKKIEKYSSTMYVYEYGGWSRGRFNFNFKDNPQQYSIDYKGLEVDGVIFKSDKYKAKLITLLENITYKRAKDKEREAQKIKKDELDKKFGNILKNNFNNSLITLLKESFKKAQNVKGYISNEKYFRYENNIVYLFPVDALQYKSDSDIFTVIIIDYNKGLIKLNKSYKAYTDYCEFELSFDPFNSELLNLKQDVLNELAKIRFEEKQKKKLVTQKILNYG